MKGNTNRAILTPAQVISIRQAIAGRQAMKLEIKDLQHRAQSLIDSLKRNSNKSLADKHGVDINTIKAIAANRNWSNL